MRAAVAVVVLVGFLGVMCWTAVRIVSRGERHMSGFVEDRRTSEQYGSGSMPRHPFEYLAMAAEKYGVDAVQMLDPTGRTFDQTKFIDSLTADDLEELAWVYREIERRGDCLALSRFTRGPGDDELGRERRQVFLLFCLFKGLGDRGIQPFASRTVRLMQEPVSLDWSKLPPELRYLAEPAEKYGKYQFHEDVSAFLDTMTPSQRQELQEIYRRSRADQGRIEEFLDMYPMTEHREAALVYFMFLLIDALPRDE